MKISNQRNVYNGHFKIELYDVTNPENGQTHTEECFERGDSVAALVFDREKQTFLFTEQFRIGSKSNLIEIVAGSMDKDGEQPIDALKRELMEEMGLEIAPPDENNYPNYQYLGAFYVSPGGCSERVHIFVVDKIIKTGNGGGVGTENINVLELTPSELFEYLRNGNILDMKTAFVLQAFFAAQHQHEHESEQN